MFAQWTRRKTCTVVSLVVSPSDCRSTQFLFVCVHFQRKPIRPWKAGIYIDSLTCPQPVFCWPYPRSSRSLSPECWACSGWSGWWSFLRLYKLHQSGSHIGLAVGVKVNKIMLQLPSQDRRRPYELFCTWDPVNGLGNIPILEKLFLSSLLIDLSFLFWASVPCLEEVILPQTSKEAVKFKTLQ